MVPLSGVVRGGLDAIVELTAESSSASEPSIQIASESAIGIPKWTFVSLSTGIVTTPSEVGIEEDPFGCSRFTSSSIRTTGVQSESSSETKTTSEVSSKTIPSTLSETKTNPNRASGTASESSE